MIYPSRMRASRRLGLAAVLVAGCFNPTGGGSSTATTSTDTTTATVPTTGVDATNATSTTTGEPGTTDPTTGAPLSGSSSETTGQSTSSATSTTDTTATADTTDTTGTTTSDETTTGTTGGETTCGDGTLQDGEECEDSNQLPGDGCDASCKREVLLIFATSAVTVGAFGGVDNADTMCRDLVAAVQTPPLKGRLAKNFVAYLSAPGADASSRIHDGGLGYARPKDLAIVAKTHMELLAGNFQIPLQYDETGAQIPGEPGCGNMPALVWTGTVAGGMTADDHCGNWMDPLLVGQQGSALSSGTAAIASCGLSCLATGRFYCVENP